MLNELVVKIGADVKQALAGLNEVQRAVGETGQTIKTFGENIFAFTTLPLGIAGAAMIKFSSDMEESLNKTRISFGDSAKSVIQWSETSIRAMGLAQGSALDAAALFGDMGTSMGIARDDAAKMSMRLVQLGADLASFKNIPIQQAMNALAGVFTGETESLKLLGVVMLETNLNAFALSQGINKKIEKMTEAEKVALRYAYVLDKTKNAQGDFARTSEGAANQMRMFQENLKELAASFGEVMLPAFTGVLKVINEFLVKLGQLDPIIKSLILVVSGLVAVIAPLSIALGAFLIVINPVIVAIKSITTSLTLAAASYTLFTGAIATGVVAVGAIASIGFAIKALIKEMDKFVPYYQDKWEKIKASTIELTADIRTSILETFGTSLLNKLEGLKGAENIVESLRTTLSNTQGYKDQQYELANTMRLQSEYRYQTALVIADQKRLHEQQNQNAGQTDYMTSLEIIRNEQTEKSLKLNSELITKSKELKNAQDDLKKTYIDSVNKLGVALEKSLSDLYSRMEKLDIERIKKYEQKDKDRIKAEQKRADDAFKQTLKKEKEQFDERTKIERQRNKDALAALDNETKAQLDYQEAIIKSIEDITEAEENAASDKERIDEIARKKSLVQNANANKQLEYQAIESAATLAKLQVEADKEEEKNKEKSNLAKLIAEAEQNKALEKARMTHQYNQRLQAADDQEEARKVVADFEYARLQDQIDFDNRIAKIKETSANRQLEIDQKYAEKVQDIEAKKITDSAKISEKFSSENVKLNDEIQKDEAEHERVLLLRRRKADVESAQLEIERIQDKARTAREAEEEASRKKVEEIQTEYERETGRIQDLQSQVESYYTDYLQKLDKFHGDKLTRTTGFYSVLNSEEAKQEMVRRGLVEKDQKQIIELLKTFNPQWQDAGRSYGEQLIDGLNSKKKSIEDAVKSILSLIPPTIQSPTTPSAKTPTSPNPLSFSEMVGKVKDEYQPVFNMYMNSKMVASSVASDMVGMLNTKVPVGAKGY